MPMRNQTTILGHNIGTDSGWDQPDTFVMMVYDFIPAPGYPFPKAESVTFDFGNGKAEFYTGDRVASTFDLATCLSGVIKP